jgi:hypothetical protein
MTMIDELDTYDWQEVFAAAGIEKHSGNTGGKPRAAIPNDAISLATFSREDVVEIAHIIDGDPDGENWCCVVRLHDGRWAALEGGCDYTGWDCQADASAAVASSLDDAVRFGLSENGRERLGIVLPEDA